MFRFIFFLVSFSFVPSVFAYVTHTAGYWTTASAASAACRAANDFNACGSNTENYFRWAQYAGSSDKYLYFFGACPSGQVDDGYGKCIVECVYPEVFNPVTEQCYIPDLCDIEPDHALCNSGDDEFPDPEDYDDSDNTGGSDNPSGGEPGAECNFSSEGCAPWDRAPDNDIADIDAPDANSPAPPDAVTTKSKTESTSDGSTTSTNVRQWEEPDGSIVKETVKETINPDGSKTTEKILERSSPNGSTATTTVKSDTDPQGNVTITGTTEDKQTEKDEYASGGGSCDAAPSCNGDPIDCAILNQQWLTRCDKNTEYSDSDCSSQPSCDGDVLLCAGLINTWQDRCALNSSASDAQTVFQDRGFKTAEDYASDGGIFGDGEEVDVSTMANGVFSSRSSIAGSCPASISMVVPNFGTFDLSLEPFCMLAEQIYWLVLLSAYMSAAFIIFRAVTQSI